MYSNLQMEKQIPKNSIKISYFKEEKKLNSIPENNVLSNEELIGNNLLEKEIIQILDEDSSNEELIISKLKILSEQNENELYTELFRVLGNIEMSSENEAMQCWKKIIENRNAYSKITGKQFSFRAAMLDYFINENKMLANPKIIEIKIYENTLKSALVDVLTGVFNRRYYEEILQNEINRARRRNSVISLCVIDIDNFKYYNDTYGHIEGDRVLTAFSSVIKRCLRREDIVCRYGGEEFVAIMPDSISENSYMVMNRISEEMRKEQFSNGESVTFSCGISSYPKDTTDKDELFIKADKAMYMAKANGKNQICIYGNERRNKIRLDVSWNISYSILNDAAEEINSDGKFHICQTFDVSLDGLCLVSDSSHKVGDTLQIVFQDQNNLNFQNKIAKIVWVKTLDENKNKIGLKFIS